MKRLLCVIIGFSFLSILFTCRTTIFFSEPIPQDKKKKSRGRNHYFFYPKVKSVADSVIFTLLDSGLPEYLLLSEDSNSPKAVIFYNKEDKLQLIKFTLDSLYGKVLIREETPKGVVFNPIHYYHNNLIEENDSIYLKSIYSGPMYFYADFYKNGEVHNIKMEDSWMKENSSNATIEWFFKMRRYIAPHYE